MYVTIHNRPTRVYACGQRERGVRTRAADPCLMLTAIRRLGDYAARSSRMKRDSRAQAPSTCRRRCRPTPRVASGDAAAAHESRGFSAAAAQWCAGIGRRWPGRLWHRVRAPNGRRRRVRLPRTASAAGRRSTARDHRGGRCGECGRRPAQPMSTVACRQRHGSVTSARPTPIRSTGRPGRRIALQPKPVVSRSADRCVRHKPRRAPAPTHCVRAIVGFHAQPDPHPAPADARSPRPAVEEIHRRPQNRCSSTGAMVTRAIR